MLEEITKILKEANMEDHVRCDIHLKIFNLVKETSIKLEKLEYWQNTHIGLWCTDRPEKIPEILKEKYFWELTE